MKCVCVCVKGESFMTGGCLLLSKEERVREKNEKLLAVCRMKGEFSMSSRSPRCTRGLCQ